MTIWSDDIIKINGIWFGYATPDTLIWDEIVDLVETGGYYVIGESNRYNRFVYPLL